MTSDQQPATLARKHAPDYTDYTDPIPEGLLAAISNDRCVALVGAGVTRRCLSKKRAPLPNWPVLLTDLVSWASERNAITAAEVRDLLELIAKSEFLMVAQEMREKLGDESLSIFIADVFDPDAIVPATVHELLSVVPFRGYITTNYDNLLERAYVNVKNRNMERILATEGNRITHLLDSNPFLLKLHGDFNVPSSIVLAHRDYLRLITDAEYQRLLDNLLSSFTLLIVGYGLTDLDVVLSLDRLAHEGISRRHYMLCKRGT
ncbi:MAG TPA: SIR2 family protein [Bryobacteraceae bacterium]|nr:SIR2 family protein [Bryobacteraceae bacterium]